MTTSRRYAPTGGLISALAALCIACGDAGPEVLRGSITTNQFVNVYVQLRVAALRTPTGEIDPEERERILSENGLSQDDLLTFVEAHGRNAVFMRGVWDSVEVAYQRERDAELEARDAEQAARDAVARSANPSTN